MRTLVTLAVALLLAGPAAACINDSDLPITERILQTSYTSRIPDSVVREMPLDPLGWSLAGLGALMLAVVGAEILRGHRRGG